MERRGNITVSIFDNFYGTRSIYYGFPVRSPSWLQCRPSLRVDVFVSLVCRVSLLEVFPGRDSCEMEVGCVVGEWKRLAWGREVNTAATDDECHSPS